ncbi:MOSC domain-containing protein YiiM [Melghirimyces profundicolus]|uniref:MOSC domain-containing protein YiiM n=1 Tax=Melghirimyces profundicolus TaxID=1242148 RepID=A0A2T6BC93_9BACL|nr:MOSC domain-containing protein [Melghirimyces profundicolus]PTX53695.1 MOSC domain-containing protein YiiM [Melghirimyces profundicolus]
MKKLQGRLVSLQVGTPRTYPSDGSSRGSWTNGIAKQAVEGPVRLGRTNLDGDGQADLQHHGGPDKAVLAYALRHYEAWRRDPDLKELGPGAFGENFTVDGLDEETVCIGDRFRVGDALVQVAQARLPCWKLDRRWGVDGLAERVKRNGKSGWYLRVIQEGTVEKRDTLELIDRPAPRWTIRAVNDILHRRNRDPEAIRECGLPPAAGGKHAEGPGQPTDVTRSGSIVKK